MRLLLIAIVTLSLGAGATFAQPDTGESSASGAGPSSPRATSPASVTNTDLLLPLRLLSPAIPRTPEIARQLQSATRSQSRQNAYDIAVADCMQMWDSGTHMTKREWSRTCKRVRTRLDSLNLEATMPKPKTTSQKSPSDKKQVW